MKLDTWEQHIAARLRRCLYGITTEALEDGVVREVQEALKHHREDQAREKCSRHSDLLGGVIGITFSL